MKRNTIVRSRDSTAINDPLVLSYKQRAALIAIAKGLSWNEAAVEAGISVDELLRWRDCDVVFTQALAKLSGQAHTIAKQKLYNYIPKLIDKLMEMALAGDRKAIVEMFDRAGFGENISLLKRSESNMSNANNIVIKLDTHRESDSSNSEASNTGLLEEIIDEPDYADSDTIYGKEDDRTNTDFRT